MKTVFYIFLLGILVVLGGADVALADQPTPWQLGFQEPVTPVMKELNSFHDMLLWIITVISIAVLLLLLYVIIRFNKKANPVPSKTAHNTLLEIVWTAVPVLILLVIAVPSIRNLYYVDHIEDADMTLKVTGYQWYWGYSYPEEGIEFESRIKDKDAVGDEPYLLAVDNQVVVPVDTNIRVLLTAADVIHSWAVPAFGVKTDAVPGRVNETWMRIEKEGTYYGQCSELCGVLHGFMPITVRAVSKEEYKRWVEKAKEDFAA